MKPHKSFAALVVFAFVAQAATHKSAVADEPATTPPPNVLFIFSDDHATAAIGAYGSQVNQTPHLDRIAGEGLLFKNSFCANSICGPSRACILTGLHSHKNGFLRNGNRFDGSQFTFPKALQQVGYQTALLGKWHLGSNPTGFDYWEILPGQGHYYNPDFIQMDGTKRRDQGYVTDLITQKTLRWLKDQRNPDQPFFLMCQHKAPHRNWSPPIRHLDLFDNADIRVPATLMDDYTGRSSLLKENEMTIARHFSWAHDAKFRGENRFPKHFSGGYRNREYSRMTAEQKAQWDKHYEPINQAFIADMNAERLSDEDITRWKYQRYMKDYLGCVQAVDDSVGQLLEYLDESGLAENTIVIYSSDQGFYLGEHGWYDKRWMFEPSLKMPLMMRWPGKIKPGSVCHSLVQNIDYAPTFLDWAGAEIPASVQGESMASWIHDDALAPETWRDAIYYAYYENAASHNVPVHDGVRNDRYKLMFFPRTGEYNLFDLDADPDEMRSLDADPNYADILKQMRKLLVQQRDKYQVNPAIIPATRADEDWWAKRERQLRNNANRQRPRIAFIGDSITQSWENAGKEVWKNRFEALGAINLGISGDRTEHVLWRLTHRGLGKIQPDAVVLMIGTNNTGHRMQDPQQVAQGITAIVDELSSRLPKTKIVLSAIFPRGEGPSDIYRKNNDAINARIQHLAERENVIWMDPSKAFLQDDETLSRKIMPDLLHLSPQGYQIWADALEPVLEPLLTPTAS
ncbi:MAG: sulfatase/phosphatase domain-containing protein [Planctomycetota bacterium]